MATPQYKGDGQPKADDSFWSGLGSWFSGGTPTYKPAPSATNSIARAIDASGLPPGSFAILVPRGVAAQCDVSDPQDDQ